MDDDESMLIRICGLLDVWDRARREERQRLLFDGALDRWWVEECRGGDDAEMVWKRLRRHVDDSFVPIRDTIYARVGSRTIG